MRHGHPGARVQYVAIALAVDVEKPFVVAARRQRTLAHGDTGDGAIGLARILDADAPQAPIGLRADEAHVAAEVHVAVPHAPFLQQRAGAVGRVFLAEAAEVDLHAGARQEDGAIRALHGRPVHQRQQRRQFAGVRHARLTKIPGAAQHAGRDVEQAAARAVQVIGVVEQLRRLCITFHAVATRRGVDAADDAVGAVARIRALDAPHFGDGREGQFFRRMPIRGGQPHFTTAGHRIERKADHRVYHRRVNPTWKMRACSGARPGLPSWNKRQLPRCS